MHLYCSELWFTLFSRVELQFQENVACPKLGVIQEKENNVHNQVSKAFTPSFSSSYHKCKI